MNLSLFIARRYLISRKKQNFINVISGLSVTGVAVISAALIIVLSVFNGLEDLLTSLHHSFDAELKVIPAKGKSFEPDSSKLVRIRSLKGVRAVTEVIEDFVYLKYRNATMIASIKGVDTSFVTTHRVPPESIIKGEFILTRDSIPYAVVGHGIASILSLEPANDFYPIQVYYINSAARLSATDPSSMYTRQIILPSGVFTSLQNVNDNYMIVPLEFARDLLSYGRRRTSLEIKVNAESVGTLETQIQQLLGSEFEVQNLEEQHADIYRLLRVEKLVAFLALSLLLLVGSVNIFFSLSMLALDKKKDITVLSSLGASRGVIRNIFLLEGGLIALSGAFIGLLLGSALCLLQQQYGFVSMGLESAVTSGYPVKLKMGDVLLTLGVVILITTGLSWKPASMAASLTHVRHL